MKVHELKSTGHSNRKRVGRGISAGQGKTAGRGTKGQSSRSGGGVRPGFEGGQNPLAKRLPKKRGFRSLNRISYQVVNLEDLNQLKVSGKIDSKALLEAGLVRSLKQPVKILGSGKLTKKLSLLVQGASKSAIEQVEKAGGKIEITGPKSAPKPAQAKAKSKE